MKLWEKQSVSLTCMSFKDAVYTENIRILQLKKHDIFQTFIYAVYDV